MPMHAHASVHAKHRMNVGGSSSSSSDRKHLDHEHSFAVYDHWGPLRRRLASCLKSALFQAAVPALIVCSFFLSLIEVEIRARGSEVPIWIGILEKTMLGLFTVELGIRLYVRRQAFFTSPWNLIDFAVVSVDICLLVLEFSFNDLKGPSASILRIFRVGRMIRISKVLVNFRELYVIVYGLVSAFKAIFWGSCLIAVAFMVFGIVAVEVLHPLSLELTEEGVWRQCDRCPHAFENIGQSCLTFVQTIIAGDSWGLVAVPIIERYPWTLFIFYGVFASVQMGLMNLILMVIVDCATESRSEDMKFQAEQKRENYLAFKKILDRVGEHLDIDGNGLLTRQELEKGAKDDEEFASMLEMMDIDSSELNAVFNILDIDGSGGVSHREFVEQFYKLKTGDQHTLMMLLKYDIHNMQEVVMSEVKNIKQELQNDRQEIRNMLSKLIPMEVSSSGSLILPEPLAVPQSAATLCTSGEAVASNHCREVGNSDGNSCGDLGAHLDHLATRAWLDIQQELQGLSQKIVAELATTVAAATNMQGKVEELQKLQSPSWSQADRRSPGQDSQLPCKPAGLPKRNGYEPAPQHAGGLPGRESSANSFELSSKHPFQSKHLQIGWDGQPAEHHEGNNLTMI